MGQIHTFERKISKLLSNSWSDRYSVLRLGMTEKHTSFWSLKNGATKHKKSNIFVVFRTIFVDNILEKLRVLKSQIPVQKHIILKIKIHFCTAKIQTFTRKSVTFPPLWEFQNGTKMGFHVNFVRLISLENTRFNIP